MFYLDRAAFRENTSVWCFWSSDDHLFQEAFRSSDLPQIPANNWTHAVYAVSHTQTHTQTFTQTCTTSHSHSKPAGSKILFHHVYSPFLQPTFRCFLNSSLFYSALLAGLTHTHSHSHLLETTFTLLLSLQNTQHRYTHTCIHTVFLPAACPPSGFSQRCWL